MKGVGLSSFHFFHTGSVCLNSSGSKYYTWTINCLLVLFFLHFDLGNINNYNNYDCQTNNQISNNKTKQTENIHDLNFFCQVTDTLNKYCHDAKHIHTQLSTLVRLHASVNNSNNHRNNKYMLCTST